MSLSGKEYDRNVCGLNLISLTYVYNIRSMQQLAQPTLALPHPGRYRPQLLTDRVGGSSNFEGAERNKAIKAFARTKQR
jgi:hypothetical protein